MLTSELWSLVCQHLPVALQESYDNCGLQVGDPTRPVTGVLCCVDITEEVLYEAKQKGCNVVIAHHPLLFKGLKRISDKGSYIERCVHLAIQSCISIYAAHTNADNAPSGINYLLAQDLGLEHIRTLQPMPRTLRELVTFVPTEYVPQVSQALWSAGAGQIGSYDKCSYQSEGIGTFRALEGSDPFVGEIGQLHREREVRLSVTFPFYQTGSIERALLDAHPYETPAYSITTLENAHPYIGAGIIGDLAQPQTISTFMENIRDYFQTKQLRYSVTKKQIIQRVAICGGAGAFLWKDARAAGADILITGEAKYNDYFDCEGDPILATVGHYESETIATKLFAQIISEKITNFAVYQSDIDSNPIIAL